MKRVKTKKTLILILLVFSVLLTGCTSTNNVSSQTAPWQEIKLENVPQVTVEALFSREYNSVINVSLAPDGNLIAVNRAQSVPGIEVFERSGRRLWTYTSNTENSGSAVKVLESGNHISYTVTSSRYKGQYIIFDRDGKVLWFKDVSGLVDITMDYSGKRLAVLEHSTAKLRLLDENGEQVGEYRVNPGGSVEFSKGGNILLAADDERVSLINPQTGRPSLDSKQSLQKNVLLANQGQYVAVTTGEGDNALYMFSRNGQVKWKRNLTSSGRNEIAFSHDDSYIYVYGAGSRSGIQAHMTESGTNVWQLYFNRQGEVRNLVSRDDGLILVHFVSMNEHRLIALNQDGRAQWQINLRDINGLYLSEDGYTMITVSESSRESGAIRSTLQAYDLKKVERDTSIRR